MLKKTQQRGANMAFWRRKQDDFEAMHNVIQQQPGISQAGLARECGIERSTVARRLPALEEAGYLCYEDDAGGLWPFYRKSK
jgi:predicted transcriptional regulator